MNPFSGIWIANIEKSQRHANHQFQSATLTFQLAGDDVSLTHAGVNMAGKHESGTSVLHPDGNGTPGVSPSARGRCRHEMGGDECSRVGGEEGRVRRG